MLRTSLILLFTFVLVGDARAQAPCASRVMFQAATARDAKLDRSNLVFCTGDACWSMDTTTRAFAPIPTIPKARRSDPPADPRATATTTGVEFCPRGKDSCKAYTYKFKFEGDVVASLNAEGTLGAVVYRGDSMENQPTWVILYDLAKPKEVKRFKGEMVEVFGKTFWVNGDIVGANGKKLRKLALDHDSGPVRLGPDLVAVASKFDSKLVAFDATAAKVAWQLDLNLLAGKSEAIDPYLIVPDGARVHVIAGAPNSGEVITVDVATGKELGRGRPPICPGADIPARPRKPEHVVKQFLLGEEVVRATKDNPLAFWMSANADSDACLKLGTRGVIDAPPAFKLLARCIKDELGKSKITDKSMETAAIDVVMHSIDHKETNQRLRDAAKGTKIVGVSYGKNGSQLFAAVNAEGRIVVVWISSYET